MGLAVGDDSGEEALAAWHLDDMGNADGAWSYLLERTYKDRAQARQLLGLIERRALVTTSKPAIQAVLSRLWESAEAEPSFDCLPVELALPEILQEIAAWRRDIEEVVERAQDRNRNLVALEWVHRLPQTTSFTIAALADAFGIVRTTRTQATSEALLAARVVGRIAEIWAATEQVRARRKYLVDLFGAPQRLPSGWAATLRAADRKVFPL